MSASPPDTGNSYLNNLRRRRGRPKRSTIAELPSQPESSQSYNNTKLVATEPPHLPSPSSNQSSNIQAGKIDFLPTPATRIHLEEGDILLLVRLCVANQADFVYRKKTDFWIKMSTLLEQETGKKLRDPASTIKSLVTTRRVSMPK